jgi:drug/metabolite transporter (DMT)-like permease
MSWMVGLGFGLASAFATNVGFLMRHRGAVAAPDVDVRHPLRSGRDLFRSKWWAIGFAVAFGAWTCHVMALKLAPLSLVQAVLASGFVLLGIAAERWFGFHLRKRDWAGIGLTAAGLALLAVTAAETKPGGAQSSYGLGAAIAFEAALVGVGALLLASPRLRRASGQHGVLLGAGSGLLFTVTHIAIKALSKELHPGDPSSFLTPWIPLVILAALAAFFASARSLQIGEAVPVIAVTGVASNLSAMLAGVVVFGDPLGHSPLLVALRIAAFALVIFAAALMPAPVRASGAEKGKEAGKARSREPQSVPA